MRDRLRIEFNEWARAGRGESMERGHRPVGEQAIDKMALAANARVLDVGCGSGWASRLMVEKATRGRVVGIDISDEMIRVAAQSSKGIPQLEFRVAGAESLPFGDDEFSDVFSMESLYYYADISAALREIHRVLESGGQLLTVIDLYQENEPSHQWIETLRVPVHLLSIPEYHALLQDAGFVDVCDERLLDPTPVPENYSGGSFKTREDFLQYRKNGSLMLSGRARK
jgi:SAM-dependent methyltransferase